LEDLGLDGRTVLKCIFKKLFGMGMDWIVLAQDRNSPPRAVVNAVMNLRVP
jgi:hypothetical protein